jgi:hypothetical protein
MSALVATCYSRACAPPPVGTGGSRRGARRDLSRSIRVGPAKTNLLAIQVEGRKLYPKIGRGARTRDKMPQVPKEFKNEFIDFLESKGIRTRKRSLESDTLIPMQTQIDARKVLGMAGKIKSGGFKNTDEGLILTARSHIIDGHHRAAAHRVLGLPLRVFDIDADPARVMRLADQFVSSKGIEAQDFSV